MREGTLLWIRDYIFDNGLSKSKFFLVLREVAGKTIIVSLPSSRDYIPQYREVEHGCIELPGANLNCYCFLAGNTVTTSGFSFIKNTFLYGMYLDEIDINRFFDLYIEGVDYEIKGILKQSEPDHIGLF